MLQGERLRKLRRDRQYTQEDLANLIDIHMRQIPRYEANDVDPSSAVLSRMADVFDVNADYLLGRVDDPTPLSRSHDLSEKEQAIISAIRRNEPLTAIRLIVSLDEG